MRTKRYQLNAVDDVIQFDDIKVGDNIMQGVYYHNGDMFTKSGTVISINKSHVRTESFAMYRYTIPKNTNDPRVPQYVQWRRQERGDA